MTTTTIVITITHIITDTIITTGIVMVQMVNALSLSKRKLNKIKETSREKRTLMFRWYNT